MQLHSFRLLFAVCIMRAYISFCDQACFLCKQKHRLWRCIRCPIAFHEKCVPFPENVVYFHDRPGEAICWRHPDLTDWGPEKVYLFPCSPKFPWFLYYFHCSRINIHADHFDLLFVITASIFYIYISWTMPGNGKIWDCSSYSFDSVTHNTTNSSIWYTTNGYQSQKDQPNRPLLL